MDISKAVLISDFKSLFLENLLVKIKEDNSFYESEIDEFKDTFSEIDRNIKDVSKKKVDFETTFKNEQILKFGIVIKFENLLKASKDTIVDKLEAEYKNMKRDVDLYIDKKKYDLENRKKELQELIRLNTDFLNNIKELLEKNKKFDITLEEKNNEINVIYFFIKYYFSFFLLFFIISYHKKSCLILIYLFSYYIILFYFYCLLAKRWKKILYV